MIPQKRKSKKFVWMKCLELESNIREAPLLHCLR